MPSIVSADIYSPFTSYQTLYYISNLCGFLKVLEKKKKIIWLDQLLEHCL